MSRETECGPPHAPKVRHTKRRYALAHKRRISKGHHLNVYRCSWCGFWHVGHWRPNVRRPARTA